MKRSQFVGLGLIVFSGILSQFTMVKEYPWAVWVIGLLTVVGMVLVLWEWFKGW